MPKRSMNPIDAHVGARVRLRRMLIGMSQEKLGEMLGVTFQQVQKYEKGANRIGASRLFEVSQILGVPVQYFFDDLPAEGERPVARPQGLPEDSEESFVMDFVVSQEGLALNQAYKKIGNTKLRRRVLDLVRAISSEDEAAAP
ncbi:MAG: helix-turn-helix transcriptional regulator [Alphaproteobacteria bacterium]|nr:helix-turn-helix transcriptional regulator [Alphaproteobacteria bacterium]